MGRCDVSTCAGDERLPFTCNRCGGTFCSAHRLPEAHACLGGTSEPAEEAWFAAKFRRSNLMRGTDEQRDGVLTRLRRLLVAPFRRLLR